MVDDQTPNLALPYIMAAQAQKHVTHNEAIRALDALVHLMVIDKDLASPPGTAENGDRYIVASTPEGAWSGHALAIAAYQDGAWMFLGPRPGWMAWVADEGELHVFDGASWRVGGGATVNPAPLVGVNATADATNRLSVSSAASLFNHEGDGHQLKINKHAAAATASQLFQTGFSGRAEAGLTGDDNFHIKVSADGASWKEALVADRTTGAVSFPSNNPWSGRKWTAIGDSITVGSVGPTYVTAVASALGLAATNLGASAASVSSSSSNAGTPNVQSQAAAVASDIDLVTMFVGLADFLGNATLGTIADTTASTFYGGLHAAIVAAMGASITRTVVLMPEFVSGTSPGYTGAWNTANANSNTMGQFQQAVRDVAHKFGCPVIDVGSEAGIGGLTGAQYLMDGVHPNDDGAYRIANFIIDRIPLIQPHVSSAGTVVSTPTFSPAAGGYGPTQTVSILCASPGATIHYTTDGSTPTTGSATYSSALTVSSSTTIKALAVKSGLTDSAVAAGTFTINGTVATPSASPSAGSYGSAQSVTLTCATSGASIYYTTDGSTPTSSSTLYTGAISVAATTTIKAIGIKSGYTDSAVLTAAYTITGTVAAPTMSVAAGSYLETKSVTLACATSGASIYYTTNGSTPTSGSTLYTGAISISSTTTLKAIGIKSGMADSAVASTVYTICTVSPYAWYAISDISKLFTDTGGSTAVSADGDLVARITDKSGNGRNVTQGTSGSRPIYRTSGGHKWLEYDTTKALVAASAFSLSGTGFTFGWKSRKSANDANALVFGSTSSNTVWCGDAAVAGTNYIGISGSGATNLNSNSLTAGDLTSDHTVIITVSAAGAVTFYLNGSAVGTASGLTDCQVDQLGYHTSGSRYSGRIYEAVAYASELGATDVATLHAYLNGL